MSDYAAIEPPSSLSRYSAMNILTRFRTSMRRRALDILRPGKDHTELLHILERAEAILSDEQRRMLEEMIHFQDTRVREIMVPRSDILHLPVGYSVQEAAAYAVETRVLRLPVTDGSRDQILGIVHSHELFAAYMQEREVSLRDLLHPHLTVPELSYVAPLLVQMREAKQHFAIVLDEFGGTSGLVTFTDLLEEIMGPMNEEHTRNEEPEYDLGDDGSLEVSARMHVEDLEELLHRPLPKGDYDTFGGLILNELGRIPRRGERLMVAGLDVHIQEADPRRIRRVLIKT